MSGTITSLRGSAAFFVRLAISSRLAFGRLPMWGCQARRSTRHHDLDRAGLVVVTVPLRAQLHDGARRHEGPPDNDHAFFWRSVSNNDPDKALPWVAERLKLTFADSQTTAIRQALACKVLVITGGPGVGKTHIVKAILRILSAKGVKLLGERLAAIGPTQDRKRLRERESRRFPSASFSLFPMSTPMRRTRSPCCALAASGQAAALPSPAMNARRCILESSPCISEAYRGGSCKGTVVRAAVVSA
jgi:hypothetical protein